MVILGIPKTPKRGAPVPFFALWGCLGRDLGPSLGILDGFLGDKAPKMPPRIPKTSPRGPQASPKGPPDPLEASKTLRKMFPKGLQKLSKGPPKYNSTIFYSNPILPYIFIKILMIMKIPMAIREQ